MKTSNTLLKPASNYWILAEKIIGILLLLWSLFELYGMVYVIAGMFNSGFVAAGNATISSIAIKNHLIIILSILCLYGSFMLLYKDKTGWILCVLTSLMFGINLFMSSRAKAIDNKLPLAEYYKSYGIAAMLFFIIFILLILKPIRKKYQPTAITWVIISAAILLFILDKSIF